MKHTNKLQNIIINSMKLLGCMAITVKPIDSISVPAAIIMRDPTESRILPSIGAATALAPKIGISIRLAIWSFNPMERITKDGTNITEE